MTINMEPQIRVTKVLILEGQDTACRLDPTQYYPGNVTTLTTDTDEFCEDAVFVLHDTSREEGISFSLKEAREVRDFLNIVIRDADPEAW